MRNSPALNTIAILATAAALALLGVTSLPGSPSLDTAIQQEIGRSLGEQAARLAGPGGKITLIHRDTEAYPQPAVDVVRAAFTREVGKAGKFDIISQAIQTDPLRPVQVPSGDFLETMRRGAVGDVIVSVMGPPVIPPEKRPPPGALKAKIVAFCPGAIAEQVDLKELAEQGLLHAAVISKLGVKARAVPRKDSGFTFDDIYERANHGQLLTRSGGPGQQ